MRRATRFGSQLKEFIESKDMFRVLYSSKNPQNSLFVLDSSFNPPHYGHLELIKRAAPPKSHIILLLSVNNADKKPIPASFDQRLDMIYKFGQNLLTHDSLNYTICVSKSPKFVEKSLEINQIFEGTKTYLLGFDTLVRVFNPKYYVPLTITEALDEFVLSNNFFCLTRETEVYHQVEYLNALKSGKTDLPSSWGDRIELAVNKENNSVISSSDIRSRFNSNSSVDNLTTSDIIEYVQENQIYT
ncbi:nicotinamide-nucleotide adenylyltransferase [Yamadazyma tenuis]|uniref:Cytidyltransferase-like domain-containing protein n=1 Tax=Candida tenuis (strain ATCC 10573 / BCRC 21748 / CBS 615 / JCM 9827 / NBRC 10315 / NRRL Y-1498 / VKM Y-70) TaxID=590646 RepID=G3BAL8_CANTC|nr:uncharacterized protein CANTEDRAFT_124117 [Yamadazyma tenuis ATCC 10573]EGV61436.1 hypothetical protein CANTEDRAFT_124117 [Yamadazyma tenuis ATCC 10573]WEJ92654.1 nicotinamide-nucleotide adenylyltransferase [Yamadazyma tenuis]